MKFFDGLFFEIFFRMEVFFSFSSLLGITFPVQQRTRVARCLLTQYTKMRIF
jgi:hypothetical protein